MNIVLTAVLLCGACTAGIAETPIVLDVDGKLRYHAKATFGPAALGYSAVRAGFLQLTCTPEEWGQGAKGYGRRFGSSVARSGIRGALAFGLDSTLHQDPRYYPSDSSGFRRRSVHALRGTILTHRDNGGETLSIWRFGSAYGAAFLSNQWQPDRLNTVGRGFADGTAQIGLDFAKNLAAEFWPDVRRKLSRWKR